ncbi:MAG: hypothetical protein JSU72_15625 [Deltaproteobacteria bacterium]|nr:MAG: hypothetical protein JSU72_15625 [Deltaproteobacteria bacterium]
MDSLTNSSVPGEAVSCADDLVGVSESTGAAGKDSYDSEGSSLRVLKATLLSIDWEINDETMSSLIEEIGRLENKYKDDKTLVSFLRLLSASGKYIKARKANAHPGAVRLLNSVYDSLERIVLSQDLSEDEKRKALLVQVREFKDLKQQLALRNSSTDNKKALKHSEKPEVQSELKGSEEPEVQADPSSMTPQEVLVYVLSELKQVIRDEFKALKAGLDR